MAQLRFELTAPEQLAYDHPVAMVTVPAGAGTCSILPGHAPMVTDIVPGMVNIYADNQANITKRIFVTGGYCEVATDRCSLMADDLIAAEAINVDDVRAEMADLVAKRNSESDEDAQAELDFLILVAQTKLAALA